jgi:ATP-dependent helicase HepA
VVVGLEDTCGRSFSEIDFVVIWDLPQSLLEARIASSLLDFATTKMIKMYLPYVEDTPQTVVTRWLHDGLEALHVYTPAQVGAAEEFSKAAHDLAKRMSARSNTKLDEELKSLSQKTAAAHEALQKKIEKNRDLLLEHASCRPHFADQALHRMTSNDDDPSLDSFMNRVLEHCGMLVDPKVGPRRASIKRNPEVNLHLDCIPKDGIEAAYNRRVASSRETSTFLNWDHDFVHQATHRLLSTSVGNTAYVVWEDDRAQIVLLEGIYIAEPAESDPALQIWRHMPATPVRVVVSHELEDLSSQYTTELVNKNVRNGRREWLRNNARPLHNLIPNMLRNLSQRAEYRAQELASKAGHQMELILGADILRLQRLPASAHRKEEIKRIQNQQAELKKLIVVPTLRMDSLRLIRRGPSGKGI